MKKLNPQLLKLQEKESGSIATPLLYYDYYEEGDNYFLPFSIGIEIECDFKETYKKQFFENIPYLLDFSDVGQELRFRLDIGIRGLISLYLICEQLNNWCLINPKSGIHLHVDFTDCTEALNNNEEQSNIILNHLDKWETTSRQKRAVQVNSKFSWVNMRKDDFGTMEVRICNMTFNYLELLNKINDLCTLAIKVKSLYTYTYDKIFKGINYLDLEIYYAKYNNLTIENKNIDKLLALRTKVNSMQISTIPNAQNYDLQLIKEQIKNRVKQ